jgi:hypothetical protein
MLQWLYTYVASFYSQCFICFSEHSCKCVDLDVAYVSHICLQVFYLNFVYVFCNSFKCFCKCMQMYVSIVSFAFRRMLQVLHRNVSKVDRVLHLLPRLLLPGLLLPCLGVSSSSWCRLRIRRLLPLFSMLVTFGTTRAPRGRETARKNDCRRGLPSASKTLN